uniref:Uncharacterized protein n=2 Tax=viral metagenome TaxID=1070528 RepID=A0A6M3IDD6_9ZZZZ
MKKILKIITYPLKLPVILNTRFWLHVSKRISVIQQSELAMANARIIELRASLMRAQSKIENLEYMKKQLTIQLDMELMDKYVG